MQLLVYCAVLAGIYLATRWASSGGHPPTKTSGAVSMTN
jgi:hypothetical protein